MSNQELNELKRKLYQLKKELLNVDKKVSKTSSDLEKANKLQSEIDAVNIGIKNIQN